MSEKNHLKGRGTASPVQLVLAWVLTVALCLGLAPQVAWAEGASSQDVAAAEGVEQPVYTLTITAGSQSDWNTGEVTYPTWVNKQYTQAQVVAAAAAEGGTGHAADELTMQDLMDAAVAAGDLKGYDASASSYGGLYLNALTSADGVELKGWNNDDSSVSLYWSVYDNGTYASTSFDQVKLEAGKTYQLAWDAYTSAVAPADWVAFYEKSPAEKAEGDVVTLTLTTGSKTDWNTGEVTYPTWVNKQYALSDVAEVAAAKDGTGHAADKLTMQDLLDTAVAKGDLKAYDASASSYGGLSLNGITSADGAKLKSWYSEDGSASLYWATYDNGGYASTSFDQVSLKVGNAYQLAWTAYTTASAPSDWAAFYAANPAEAPDATDSDITVTPAPNPDEYAATGVSQQDATTLMANIASSFAGSTDAWSVMDLAATGRLTADEAAAFTTAALADLADPDNTAYQRNVIALAAAGVNPAAVATTDGARDLVAEMAQRVTAASPVNVQAFTLLAYAAASSEVPADAALSEDALVSCVLSHQLSDGGFSYSGTTADADMTAMVIAALSPYAADNAEVQNAVNQALVALRGLQNADGGWSASGRGVAEGTNANSTAMAVITLCSVGVDPATQWATENGSTPLSALLSQATADKTGFIYDGKANDYATEQGFRALVAYQGLKNTGAAYNIYTQAALGQATFSVEGAGEKNQQPVQTPASSPSESEGTGVPETGDVSASAVTLSVMAGAGVAALIAARRRKAA